MRAISFAVGLLLLVPAAHAEDPLMIGVKRLSMEAALRIAQTAVQTCRKKGIQIGVTVVDRGGHPQVVLRDVLAPDLTLDISYRKAYTAMAFNVPTSDMAERAVSPLAMADKVLFAAGGLPIVAQSNILGGVGVSGAPSGKTDEECAKAGIKAVQDDLDMAD